MSPQSNSTPGLSLPSPTLDASGPVQQQPNSAPAQAITQGQIQSNITPLVPDTQQPQHLATAPPMPPSMPIAPQPSMPVSAPVVSTIPTQAIPPVSVPAQTPAPQTAPQQVVQAQDEELNLDDDALDEEWVSKAKSVAEQYQADPYMASKALSKIKAEYLQRRYGKQIKVND